MKGGKLISLLTPSRARVERLQASLNSLDAMTKNPEDIEVIIRIDSDDDATRIHLMNGSKHSFNTTVLIGERGKGYADLHLMYNEMAKVASGRFMMIWNDDAIMTTRRWDDQVRQFDDGKLKFIRSYVDDISGKRNKDFFPIVHRSYYDCLGHLSMSAHNDTYINELFYKMPQLICDTSIVVRHGALELNDDLTMKEGKACWPETKRLFGEPEVQNNLASDAFNLNSLLLLQEKK